MQTDIQLISGGVYQTSLADTPCRIIAFDDVEVFYDAYWSSLDKWAFGGNNLKRTGYYYRTPPNIFLRSAVLLREQPLTDKKLMVFMPNLPFRLCRSKLNNWSSELFSDLTGCDSHITSLGDNTSQQIIIPVEKIALQPFGPKGDSVKSTIVTSTNEEGFSCIELL